MTPYAVVMEWLHSPSVTEIDHEGALELLERLREAGFVVVPRVATPAMIVEAMITAYPTIAEAGGVVEQAQEAARLEWAAMVAAAEQEAAR